MEAKKNKNSKIGCIFSMLKKGDRFGLTFALSHDKEYEFNTVTGGLFSIILYFIVVYTIVVQMVRMIYRQEITVEVTNTENQFLSSNETVTPFENNKFMIGMYASIYGITPEKSCLHNYIDFKLTKVVQEYNETIGFIDRQETYSMEYCDETNFPANVLETFPLLTTML